ncbi:uncharacterized [Tachysurus ichikawai]
MSAGGILGTNSFVTPQFHFCQDSSKEGLKFQGSATIRAAPLWNVQAQPSHNIHTVLSISGIKNVQQFAEHQACVLSLNRSVNFLWAGAEAWGTADPLVLKAMLQSYG